MLVIYPPPTQMPTGRGIRQQDGWTRRRCHATELPLLFSGSTPNGGGDVGGVGVGSGGSSIRLPALAELVDCRTLMILLLLQKPAPMRCERSQKGLEQPKAGFGSVLLKIVRSAEEPLKSRKKT